MTWIIITVVIIAILILLAVKSIKVVKQSEVYIIERLGKFHKLLWLDL